jgi:Domain of unknown function (DUF3127)
MEIIGKVIQVLPEQTGQGKNGVWKKQEFILETDGTYPKKICIAVWGDKIDAQKMQEGATLNVSFDVESREYNGRWYTDVKAWRLDFAEAGSTNPAPASGGGNYATAPAPAAAPVALSADLQGGDEDLPF